MKKLILFSVLMAAVAASGLIPFERHDVADLKPVQALVVSYDRGYIDLNGGEVRGRGRTWKEAMADLHRSGSGTVFLSTAEQIILVQSAVRLLPEVLSDGDLRPAAQVCMSGVQVTDVRAAAEYLSAHPTGVTIGKLRTVIGNAGHGSLPVLVYTEGGLRIHGA